VLAMNDPEQVLRLSRYIAQRFPQVRVIARARDREHASALQAAGASESVREVFHGAVRAGELALAACGYQPREIEDIAATFAQHEQEVVDDLAAVCDPAIPAEGNPPSLAKTGERQATAAPALGDSASQ
jgi:CPA2 family monovalent cation:H+ antiporter-2